MAAGHKVPIFRGLLKPLLIAGVPRTFAMFNVLITVEFVLFTRVFWWIIVAIIIHVVIASLIEKDRHFFAILARNIRMPSYFW